MSFDVDSAQKSSTLRSTLCLGLFFAVVKLSIHLYANWLAPKLGYDFFRDELYFIDCGRHLAWGYVDQMPMVALQARMAEFLFGTSQEGMRLLSALAGSGTVLLTGLLAWALGGSLISQALAMLTVLLSPFYLAFGDYLSMNSFEPVFWMAIMLAAVLLGNGGSNRWWIVIGIACGLGIENKPSIIFFVLSMLLGIAISPKRRILYSWWVFAAVILAIVIALPNVFWQVKNHWPTWQFLHNPQRPIVHHHFLGFVRQQLFLLNVTSLIVGAGLAWLLWNKESERFRFAGITFIVFFLVMFKLHARSYYLAPFYPVLIAAGAIAWEEFTRGRRWWLWCSIAVLCVYDLAYLPMSIPVQRPECYVRYRAVIVRLNPLVAFPNDGSLGQWYSDKIGWRQMVASVARVYWSLPPAERPKTAILTQFYGDASAIDFYRRAYGLPPAISGNQNFWFWGPRGQDEKQVIAVGFTQNELPPIFDSVKTVGHVYNRYATDYENRPIFLCSGIKVPLSEYWIHLKHWM